MNQAVSSSSQIPLPDNLLSNLASHPTLIMSLTSVITPNQLLQLCVRHLLDAPVDETARADDPQGVLTKFGESVVFVEALVDVFELQLPALLARSRRAVSLGHINEVQRTCLNGWVKALVGCPITVMDFKLILQFSTEGIDDQILL
jgi:mediator of RNA polymerase II transcription subunit 5